MAKKTLDDLFRDDDLDDFGGPSPELWRRLESRLEARLEDRKRAARRRKIRFLQLGAVAGTVFLLGLAAAFVLFFQRKNEQKNQRKESPVLIDTLGSDSSRLLKKIPPR